MTLGKPRSRGKERILPVVIPPSYRFCVLCQEVREFKYSSLTGHSQCQVCLGGIAKAFYPKSGLRKELHCFNCLKKTPHKQTTSSEGIVMVCECGMKRRK